jgi:murein DD-endopeptidase MepM/ murein hydrolase activator NlpD
MSKKAKFHFNPDTLSYEKIEPTIKNKLGKATLHIVSSIFVGFIFFLLFSFLIDSPKEKQLKQTNETLTFQYKLLNKRLDQMQTVMENMQQRDNNLYRVIFQADPIPEQARHYIDNTEKYENSMSTPEILNATVKRIDNLSKMIYTQSQSFDDLTQLAKNNEEKLKHIPAIQPVLNKDLTRLASGYGYRIDPIYRTRKMHQGMDFTAPIGTDVYATGDGTVIYSGWMQGYGNTIEIDHGFGYRTLYGHLNKVIARKGKKVKRGDIVGLVGNTGKSTGPHLHYEVIFKDKNVDPKNYYFLDLSPEEYDRMIQLARNAGQVLD